MEDLSPPSCVFGEWGGAWERAVYLGRMARLEVEKPRSGAK